VKSFKDTSWNVRSSSLDNGKFRKKYEWSKNSTGKYEWQKLGHDIQYLKYLLELIMKRRSLRLAHRKRRAFSLDDLKELANIYPKLEDDHKSKTERKYEDKEEVLPFSTYLNIKGRAEERLKKEQFYTNPEQRLHHTDYSYEHLRRDIKRDYRMPRLKDIYGDREYGDSQYEYDTYSPSIDIHNDYTRTHDRLWDNRGVRDFTSRRHEYNPIESRYRDHRVFSNSPSHYSYSDTLRYHYDPINSRYRNIYAENGYKPLYESSRYARSPYEGFSINNTPGSNEIYEVQYPTYSEARIMEDRFRVRSSEFPYSRK